MMFVVIDTPLEYRGLQCGFLPLMFLINNSSSCDLARNGSMDIWIWESERNSGQKRSVNIQKISSCLLPTYVRNTVLFAVDQFGSFQDYSITIELLHRLNYD